MEVRPGTWRIRVYLGADPVTSHPRQATRTVKTAKRGGRAEAQRALDALRMEIDARRARDDDPTLSDLLERWLDHLRRQGRKELTLETYENHIRLRIRPKLGHIKVRDLDGGHLDRFYAELQDQGLATGTIQLHHSILSGALTQAVKWNIIDVPPTKRASRPAGKAPEKRAPTDDEVRRLLQAAVEEDPDYGMALALIALTGCRRGEVCGLRWSDVDWNARTLLIGRALVPGGGGLRLGTTKTGGARLLAMDDYGLGLLRDYRDTLVARTGREPEGWLVSHNGGISPLSGKRLTEYVGTLGKRLKPPITVTPHQIRHWAASHLVSTGMDIRTVSNRLGHASTEMTLNVYTHAVPANDRVAADALARALMAGPDPTTEEDQ